jgi:nucleoside-diphosphate-sugar epimerase
MTSATALVTGASGELGQLLIPTLAARGVGLAAVDLVAPPAEVAAHCAETLQASILDAGAMRGLFERIRPTLVFHLAAVLSASAERDPEQAHRVNVEGTVGLLRLCRTAGEARHPVRFLFPSSIAVYGLPDAAAKLRCGALRESEWTVPSGVYGATKLYCELLGANLSRRPAGPGEAALDFRSIRFPGLISAETLPSGGTTDYAPEMIHAAAAGRPYACFVAPETRLPFMTMPDGVEALLRLAQADAARLTTRVYNVRGFSASAGEIREEVLRHFPQARIEFDSQAARQALVDSWPADVDDSAARRDWGLAPRHGLREAFGEYLLPALGRR